jgi:hypothetical protein
MAAKETRHFLALIQKPVACQLVVDIVLCPPSGLSGEFDSDVVNELKSCAIQFNSIQFDRSTFGSQKRTSFSFFKATLD